MNRRSIRIAALSAALLLCAGFLAGAQNDSTYYVKPEGVWHLRLRSDIFGTSSFVGVPYQDQYAIITASTGARFKQCVGAGWKNLFLNIGFNPFAKQKDLEFNVNVYGNKLGFNMVGGLSNTMTGYIGIGDLGDTIEPEELPENGLLNISAKASMYYAFNWKRFSFPAAMNQNRIQKRSAGSPLVTARAYLINMYPQEDPEDVSLDDGFVSLAFGLGGGYAYNWVPVERLLIHISGSAEYGFLNRTYFFSDGSNVTHVRSNNVLMISGNLSAVYYFKKMVYLGVFASSESLLSANFTAEQNNTDFLILNRKMDAHLAVGIRL